MAEATTIDGRIAAMPRGGPDASWLDRRLQTETPEYADRSDVPDDVKQTMARPSSRHVIHFGPLAVLFSRSGSTAGRQS